jgi:hypothetical protein
LEMRMTTEPLLSETRLLLPSQTRYRKGDKKKSQ